MANILAYGPLTSASQASGVQRDEQLHTGLIAVCMLILPGIVSVDFGAISNADYSLPAQ